MLKYRSFCSHFGPRPKLSHNVVCSMGVSAEELLSDLAAVQKFLQEFKSTVSHQVFAESLKAQALGLTSRIARVASLQPEQATKILVALRTGPWTEEILGALSHTVSATIAASATAKAAPSTTQNFMGIENYCTTDMLNIFKDKDTSLRLKISHLTSLLLSLGVHAPTEKSVQRCIGFLLLLHMGMEAAVAMDSSQKLCLAIDLKSTIKTSIAKTQFAHKLLDYPMSPTELQTMLPSEFAACYCSQGPVDADISLTQLMVVVQSVPMRKTNRTLKDKEPPTLNLLARNDQVGPSAMAMMQQIHMVQCKTLEMLPMMAGQHPAQTSFSPASSSRTPSLGCISPLTPRPFRPAIALGNGGSDAALPVALAPPAVPEAAAPPAEEAGEAADEGVQGGCPEGREAHPLA